MVTVVVVVVIVVVVVAVQLWSGSSAVAENESTQRRSINISTEDGRLFVNGFPQYERGRRLSDLSE